MSLTIKVILVALLLGCLAPMPYGYFMFVRFAAMVGFGYLGYQASLVKQEQLKWTFFALAILFQPFYKIALGRPIWNIIDAAVAAYLIWSIIQQNKKN